MSCSSHCINVQANTRMRNNDDTPCLADFVARGSSRIVAGSVLPKGPSSKWAVL
jgi:hypothetical protein